MNLQKYNVEGGSKQTFIDNFKKLMNTSVKSIVVIDNLISYVEPIGDLPIGFVLRENAKWYLVGWTNTKKRCHPQSLFPHRKKEVLLYECWNKKTWTYRELYKCIFQRLRQLDDLPTVISSIKQWEQNRQALFSCVKLLNDDVLNKLKCREINLLKHIMKDNDELLHNTCSALCIDTDIDVLSKKVGEMYSSNILFENEEHVYNSGILKLIQDHVSTKWNI